jgi:hypothetical protein
MSKHSNEACLSIDKLLSDDMDHQGSAQSTSFARLSAAAKAALVMQGEKAVMATDPHPFIGFMQKKFNSRCDPKGTTGPMVSSLQISS